MRQGLELQHKTRARVQDTSEGQAMLFGFWIGPIHVFVIAGLPEHRDATPQVYIKMTISPSSEWEFFKLHRSSPKAKDYE